MSASAIAFLVAAATLAGVVDAIAGGGGLITLPSLLTTGLPLHTALATNKGASMFGSGSALFTYWRHRQVDGRLAALTFPLGLAGALVGASLVLLVPPATLRPIVIALLVGAAALMIVRKPLRLAAEPPPYARWAAAILAFVIGAYDGFFGPGTGTFLIVGFVVLCAQAPGAATANAKVVNFASNIAAVILFAVHGKVMWTVALPMAAGQIVGGTVGARLALRGGARLIRAAVLAVSSALVVKLAIDWLG